MREGSDPARDDENGDQTETADRKRTAGGGGFHFNAGPYDSLPTDVVTRMALSLGTPHRPTRASPSLIEKLSVAWRICDLLFYGEDLPIAMSILAVVHDSESAESREAILESLLAVFHDNHQLYRLLRANILMQLRKEVHCKEVLEGKPVRYWFSFVEVSSDLCESRQPSREAHYCVALHVSQWRLLQ